MIENKMGRKMNIRDVGKSSLNLKSLSTSMFVFKETVSPKHGSNQGIEGVSYNSKYQVQLIVQALTSGCLKPGEGGLKMCVNSGCASTKIGENTSHRISKSGINRNIGLPNHYL